MPLETLFKMVTYGVLPFWALLFFAPRWSWTQRLVHSPVLLLLLTPLYVFLLFFHSPMASDGNFRTLYGLMILFTSPSVVLAGWIHYLIFDLFVGAWEARDAMRRGMSHLWVLPCLMATLLAGPIGLLLYVVVRFATTRAVELDEHAALERAGR